MSYKVVKSFSDLQDNRFVYKAGDLFPRDGMDVSEDRLKELSGSDNKLGTPLIEKVEEAEPEKKPTKKKRSKDAD